MPKVHEIINKIKTRPDIWFFYLFILVFSLSIRKVLLFYPINGEFNEYTGIYLYLSDILLILTIGFWIVPILYNKFNELSTNSEFIHSLFQKNLWITCWKWIKCSTRLPRPGTGGQAWNILKENPVIFFLFLLSCFSFLSIIWSDNRTIAIFRSFKVFEGFLLASYIALRIVPRPPRLANTVRRCEAGGTISREENTKMFHLPTRQAGVEQFQYLRNSILIIILVASIQSILAIGQVFSQNSLNLSLLWESQINPDIPGVAKIIIGNNKYIRAYGLFPHPNILGGFLLFSIILSFFYLKNVPRGTFRDIWNRCSNLRNETNILYSHLSKLIKGISLKCSTWNKTKVVPLFEKLFSELSPGLKELKTSFKRHLQRIYPKLDLRFTKELLEKTKLFHARLDSQRPFVDARRVEQLRKARNFIQKIINGILNIPLNSLFWLIIVIQSIALILTISKSAIFGLLIAVIYISYKIVPRLSTEEADGTISEEKNVKMFHVEQFKRLRKIFLLSFLIFAFIVIDFKVDPGSLLINSLKERLVYLNVSRGTFLENSMIGAGIGQFVPEMIKDQSFNLENWQFQPVHNVFLLVASELGYTGIMIFVAIFASIFFFRNNKIVPRPLRRIEASGILNIHFKGILAGFLFIILFDHYFWDIQQGSLLLWLTLGFLLRRK